MKFIEIKKWHIFSFCLFIYFSVYLKTGFIPVNGGAGFDGSVYLDYIIKLSSGIEIDNDPYRLMRMSGFLPAILISNLGLDSHFLIYFQATFNAVILSLGAVLFYDSAEKLTREWQKAIISTAILFFSWPYLVMPIYYPILSDHLALFLSVVSVWAWVREKQKILFTLIFVSTWVMPGLSILPIILSALPKKIDYGLDDQLQNSLFIKMDSSTKWKKIEFFIFILLATGVAYIAYKLFSLTDEEILSHPPSFEIGMYALRNWSAYFVICGLVIIAVFYSKILSSRSFWKIISFKNSVLSVVFFLMGVASINYFINWDVGYKGPPLLNFLLLQSIAAPAKPIVAHFIHFGPVIIVAMLLINIFKYSRPPHFNQNYVLMIAFCFYLPILIMGSESRQWIAVFPLAVLLVAVFEKKIQALFILLLWSIAFCMPLIFLKNGVASSFSGRMSYMSSDWQLYFGRQGPWMSNDTYAISLFVASIFFITYIITVRKN